MAEGELSRQMRGERLTTAEVLYYMPDHPVLLQRFLWQTAGPAAGVSAGVRLPRFLAARDRGGDPLGELLGRGPDLASTRNSVSGAQIGLLH